MKTRMLLPFLLVVYFIVLPQLNGQVPDWEDAVPLNDITAQGSSVVTAVSDGYGQHVLAHGASGYYKHLLLDNQGIKIASHSEQVSPPRHLTEDVTAAITSSGGVISIVAANGTTQLYLYQSTTGGSSWLSVNVYNLPFSVTVHQIDAFADGHGVHIVWDNTAENKVYYNRCNTNGTWEEAFEVTSLGTGAIQGYRPKVVSSSGKVYVSFVRKDAGTYYVGSTRDYDLIEQTWDASDSPAGQAGENGDFRSIYNQSIAIRGSTLHMVMRRTFANATDNNYRLYEVRRDLTESGSWTAPVSLLNSSYTQNINNHRRELAVVGDTAYSVYAKSFTPNNGLKFLTFMPDDPWPHSTYFSIDDFSANMKETISSSKTGVYAYYIVSSGVQRMRRKVITISGTIAENMFFTGNNWINGDTYIADGKTVWLKSNSETNILAGNSLVVQDGATLIVEPDATVNIESGGGILVEEGGVVEVLENATFTIPGEGDLIAEAGSQFTFGENTNLVINGQLTVSGSQAQPVLFEPSGPSVTSWGGITIDNNASIVTTSIDYASISDCGSGIALSATTDARLSVTNSVIDNAAIGLEIVPPGSQGPSNPPIPTMLVTNNTFSNITMTGISVDGLSTLVLQGNTISQEPTSEEITYGVFLTNASPKLLNNDVTTFNYGLYCLNGSSPALEEALTGGNNIITECIIGVASDNSDPILGKINGGPVSDDGGQNSIFSNSAYDVKIWNKSTVMGENNWYGADDNPPGNFDVDGDSYLDYLPYLPDNPNLDGPGGGGSGSGGERFSSTELVALRQVLTERAAGNYNEAMALLKSIVEDQEEPTLVKEWAIRQMIAIAQFRRHSGLSLYLQDVMNTSSTLARQVKSILPAIFGTERSTSDRLAAFNANIQEFPNTHIERSALYGKLVHAIYSAKDHNAASQLFAQLGTGYPGSAEAAIGRVQLLSFQTRLQAAISGNRSNGVAAKPDEESSLVAAPKTYGLSENYPNPFNPTTALSFDLPEPSTVSLIIYDVLGRKVAELAAGPYGEGYHSATWNASDQASGIYFARFTATSAEGKQVYSKVNKLVLMK